MAQVGLRELLEAGVHFGHQTRRWNPKMRRGSIFGERYGYSIIICLNTQRLLYQVSSSSATSRNAVAQRRHSKCGHRKSPSLGLAGRPKAPALSTASSRAPRVRTAPRHAASSAVASRPRVIGNTALALAHDFQLSIEDPISENVVVPMSVKVTIVDLNEAMCKWPLGDPTTIGISLLRRTGEWGAILHLPRKARVSAFAGKKKGSLESLVSF